MASARILITGASAFVGRHITRHLADRGFDATATIRRAVPAEERAPNVRYVTLDLADATAFSALPRDVDTVVHLAAAASDQTSASAVTSANVSGMLNLLTFARDSGVSRFIFASSLSVHGDITAPVVDEHTPVVNPTAYGLSKRMGELLLADFSDHFASTAIRLPAVLGAGARRHWPARVLEMAAINRDIEIFNPDASFNNAVDVDDLADFIALLCRRDGPSRPPFPVASSGMTTVAGAVRTIIAARGSTSRIVIGSPRQTPFNIDIAAAQALGFRPRPIEDALSEFARAQTTAAPAGA